MSPKSAGGHCRIFFILYESVEIEIRSARSFKLYRFVHWLEKKIQNMVFDVKFHVESDPIVEKIHKIYLVLSKI